MKTPILILERRIRRLSRPQRIHHLRAIAKLEKPRSVRRLELEALLKAEIVAQLRKENRAA